MTPKEKAEELLKKFFPDLRESLDLELTGIRKKHAIKYSLIAVGEIETVLLQERVFESLDYWKEVKQEIKLL